MKTELVSNPLQLPAPDRHEASRAAQCMHGEHSKTLCANWIFGQCPIACPHALDHAAQEQPAPDGSAVEWVKNETEHFGMGHSGRALRECAAIELAQRCDAAEKELASVRTMFRHHNDQLADEQNQVGLLKGELHTTKAKLAAAERTVERLRGALEEIGDLGGMTLLGPGPQDGEVEDERHAHSIGAAKAFNQAAERARAALAETKEDASNE